MIVNLRHVDTHPGAEGGNPFTPPAGFDGDADAYVALMQARYLQVGYGQHMVCMARRMTQPNRYPLEYSGPYAEQARGIINRLVSAYRQAQAA